MVGGWCSDWGEVLQVSGLLQLIAVHETRRGAGKHVLQLGGRPVPADGELVLGPASDAGDLGARPEPDDAPDREEVEPIDLGPRLDDFGAEPPTGANEHTLGGAEGGLIDITVNHHPVN